MLRAPAFAIALLSLLLPALGGGMALAGRTAVLCVGGEIAVVAVDAEGAPVERASSHDGPCLSALSGISASMPAAMHRLARNRAPKGTPRRISMRPRRARGRPRAPPGRT